MDLSSTCVPGQFVKYKYHSEITQTWNKPLHIFLKTLQYRESVPIKSTFYFFLLRKDVVLSEGNTSVLDLATQTLSLVNLR